MPPVGAGGGAPSSTVARHEFWVSDDQDDAVRKAKITLKRVGELTDVVPGSHVKGTIKFGLYSAELRISWRPESESPMGGQSPVVAASTAGARRALMNASTGTTLILEAEGPHSRDAGTRDTAAKSALERFEEAYHHFDDVDYKPDRLGLLPMTIFGVIIFAVLVGYALMRTPFVQHLLPKHAITISATNATPEPSPSASTTDETGFHPEGH